MKKLLAILLFVTSLNAYSQNTTTLPSPTTSFTPSFRYYGTLTDSLRQTWFATSTGGWNRLYTATEANLRFAKLAGGNTFTGFQNIWNGSNGVTLGYAGSMGAIWGADIGSKFLSNAGIWLQNDYTALNTGTSAGTIDFNIGATQKVVIENDTTRILNKVKIATAPNKNDMPLRYQDSTIYRTVSNSFTKSQANTFKVYQDWTSYSTFSNLGTLKLNSGVVLIGDSNSENFGGTGVDNSWFNYLATAIQKTQGPYSGIAFTNFNDPTRYGLTYGGTTSVVSSGPTNSAIQLNSGATITFTAAAGLVEFWYDGVLSTGSLQLSYNGTPYRTVVCTSGNANTSSFANSATPSTASGTYTLTATGGDVVITALFTSLQLVDPTPQADYTYFIRAAVSGASLTEFDYSDAAATTSLTSTDALYLVPMGTNDIFNPSKATTVAQYGINLTNTLNTLTSAGRKVVYLIPPATLQTTYPAVISPYANYHAMAIAKCDSLNIRYIDLNDCPDINTSTYYAADGLHYNNLGQQRIGYYVINQLAKIDVKSQDYASKVNVADNYLTKNNPTYDGTLATNSSTAGESISNAKDGFNLGIGMTSVASFLDFSSNKGWRFGYDPSSQKSYLLAGSNGPATAIGFKLYNGSSFIDPLTLNNNGSISILTPATSAGNHELLSFNTSTGVIEKVAAARTSTVSSAGTLTLVAGVDYSFDGTTATWTLPAPSAGNAGGTYQITIKNRGSGALTVNPNSGTEIYTNSNVSTVIMLAGTGLTFISDGTYWNVIAQF